MKILNVFVLKLKGLFSKQIRDIEKFFMKQMGTMKFIMENMGKLITCKFL